MQSRGVHLPPPHRTFLDNALHQLPADPRLIGLAVGGSYLDDALDEFSDLDFVVGVEPAAFDEVMVARLKIARGLGPLLAGFSGEHVGEPRVLICLYGPPLLHVDLKFVSEPDLAERVEDPQVLWERDGRMTAALERGEARFPQPDPQWIEDRFWVWVHYGAAKIGRGELFEALGFLAFLRERVLGPLALASRGEQPTGVRKLERLLPDLQPAFEATVAAYSAHSAAAALGAASDFYLELREDLDVERHEAAEREALAYLEEIAGRAG